MAMALASATITAIRPRFLAFWRHKISKRNNSSVSFASRILRFDQSHVSSSSSSSSHPCRQFSQRSISAMTTPQDSANSSSSKTERVVIKGRVQGVFYRNWTIENATQLGLKGWVRNRRDGSVEALFSGNPDAVKEMEQRCRRGPPEAVVTDLQVFPSNDDPGSGFDRKPTV